MRRPLMDAERVPLSGLSIHIYTCVFWYTKLHMKRYIVLNKPRGKTPLEVVTHWKQSEPAYKQVRASYAGRLDPMASGKLLVLLGEECKNQKQYTKLDKEYEIEILLDIGTDTGDVLGLASLSSEETHPAPQVLKDALQAETGTHERAYPAYSSKTVKNIPLFLYALKGTLGSIEIPTHPETIYTVGNITASSISKGALQKTIVKLLHTIPRDDAESKKEGADFRQDVIRERWQELFSSTPERMFTIVRVRVTAGTGTYMRTLAERVGDAFGTRALALSIKRTKIGRYLPIARTGIWIKQY